MSELPEGWRLAKLGELAQYLNGAAFKPDDWGDVGVPIIRIQNLNDPSKPMNRTTRPVNERLRVCDGDVLVSWSATLDAFIWDRGEAWLNQHIFRVLPHESLVDKRFLFFLLKREIASLIETEHLHGSTMKHINRGPFLSHQVALPPLAEQRRIVARLDVLLGCTRRAREELAHVPRLVERQRQAVLAAAFRGELTSTWRKDANTIEKGPWPIPQSWSWGVIADVAEVASNLVSPNEVLDLPHIAPNHIEAGVPKLLAFNTVREDGVISPKHRFFSGQIVYSKIRPYLRKAVLVDFDGACSADMYPIRAKYHPKYLLYWLISHDFNDLRMEHQGRTVLPKINQNALYQIATPIPPEAEQQEIAARIEAAFARIERAGAEAMRAAALVERLEQATLARAFRGAL